MGGTNGTASNHLVTLRVARTDESQLANHSLATGEPLPAGIRPAMIQDPDRAKVVGAIITLSDQGEPITKSGVYERLLTVAGETASCGTDWGTYLDAMIENAPYVPQVAAWARQITRADRVIAQVESTEHLLSQLNSGNTEAAREELSRLTGLMSDSSSESTVGIDAAELIKRFPTMRPQVIEGVARRGETLNIAAAPKCGKSWLALLLAICVVCGLKWLGRFWTTLGKVLIIDNELHEDTSAARLATVATALGITPDQYAGRLTIWNVRGQQLDLVGLCAKLSRLKPGQYDLIIIDAFYRFIPKGFDENSNADMTAMFNMEDAVAGLLGCVIGNIMHTSKGNQSGRAVTDVGVGAGAQSRAADTHLVMRPHEEEGAVVVEAAVRSFAPLEPFCMRMKFPLWEVADDLDPKDLRQDKLRKSRGIADESGESPADLKQQRDAEARQKLLDAYATFPGGETQNSIRDAAGMSGRVFGPLNLELVREGVVEACKVTKNRCEYPGFRLVQVRRSDNPDNSDKTASCPTCPTEGGVHSRTSVSPLGDAVSPICPQPSDSNAVAKSELKNLSDLTEINHEQAAEFFPMGAA